MSIRDLRFTEGGDVGKGFVSITYDMIGTPVRKDGELGFRASERCAGLTQIMGSEATNTGTCLTVDPDGDRMFITFARRNQEVGSWRAVSGTGKYEGAEATGTWEPMMVPARPARPDFGGSCNKVTGRWNLKQGS